MVETGRGAPLPDAFPLNMRDKRDYCDSVTFWGCTGTGTGRMISPASEYQRRGVSLGRMISFMVRCMNAAVSNHICNLPSALASSTFQSIAFRSTESQPRLLCGMPVLVTQPK